MLIIVIDYVNKWLCSVIMLVNGNAYCVWITSFDPLGSKVLSVFVLSLNNEKKNVLLSPILRNMIFTTVK